MGSLTADVTAADQHLPHLRPLQHGLVGAGDSRKRCMRFKNAGWGLICILAALAGYTAAVGLHGAGSEWVRSVASASNATLPRMSVQPLALAQQHLRRSADDLIAAARAAASQSNGKQLYGLVATQLSSEQDATASTPVVSMVASNDGAVGSGAPERMVIMCGTHMATGWVSSKLGDIAVAAYTMVPNISEHRGRCPPGQEARWPVDCPAHAAQTHGREASAYIQFIVDHWDNLPKAMLFLHAHETSWHRGLNSPALLQRLRWDNVAKLGYASIRHWGYTNWNCGTVEFGLPCWRLGSFATPQDAEEAVRNPDYNWLWGDEGWAAWTRFSGWVVASHWDRYFKEWFGELPEFIGEPSNHAEFVTSAERVRLRPLAFWQNALAQMELPDIKEGRRGIEAAQVFETIWHLVLGQPANDHAVSKCELYHCSEEEKADPRLVAPPVPEPYIQRFMVPRTNWVNIVNGTEPAPEGDAAAALWQTYDRHDAGPQP